MKSHDEAIKLVDVARWLSSQSVGTMQALEELEPLSWLRHLKKNRSHPERFLWNLSALMVEEYAKSLGFHLQELHGDPTADIITSTPLQSVHDSLHLHTPHKSSYKSPESFLPRKRDLDDEARVQSRNSFGGDSKWSSEYRRRTWLESNGVLSNSSRNSSIGSFQQYADKSAKSSTNKYSDSFQIGATPIPGQIMSQSRFESFSSFNKGANHVYHDKGRRNLSNDSSSSFLGSSVEEAKMTGRNYLSDLTPNNENLFLSNAKDTPRSAQSLQPSNNPRPLADQSVGKLIGGGEGDKGDEETSIGLGMLSFKIRFKCTEA